MNGEKEIFTRQHYEKAKKAYSDAIEQNQQLNKEHREILTTYYEKLGMYSLAAIPFSTTLVGLTIDRYSEALALVVFFSVELRYLAFIAWILLGLAFLTSLISKRFDSYYISNFGMANYTQKYKEFLQREKEVIGLEKDLGLFETDYKSHMKNLEKDIETLEKAESGSKGRRDFYYSMMVLAHGLTEAFAVIGFLLIIMFAIFLFSFVK